MNTEIFFQQFGLLADAPNGIAKLRELILQLAVQGKLVPQNPDDEPASVLLAKIKAEKEKLIKEGKIKKPKKLKAISPDEVPFELPEGWEWERLCNLTRFIDYRGKTPVKEVSGVKLITAKNVRMGFIKDEPKEYISEKTYEQWMTRGFPKYGDLLFTIEAPLGNVAQLLYTEKIALAQRVINFQLFGDTCSAYLKYSLMSKALQDALREKSTGMTAKGIKAAKLKLILIPLPPLTEQYRIVAKVNQLMTYCDELEAKLTQSLSDKEKLMDTAVYQLLSA